MPPADDKGARKEKIIYTTFKCLGFHAKHLQDHEDTEEALGKYIAVQCQKKIVVLNQSPRCNNWKTIISQLCDFVPLSDRMKNGSHKNLVQISFLLDKDIKDENREKTECSKFLLIKLQTL